MLDLKKLKNSLPTAGDLLFVCRTGSAVYCSKNHRDEDFVAVFNELPDDEVTVRVDGGEYFCYSLEGFKQMATLSSGKFYDLYAICLLLSPPLFGQNPITNYNWFDYKERVPDVLLRCGEVNYFSPNIVKKNKELGYEVCPKKMCWAFASVFCLTNYSAKFDEKQRKMLQDCHDGVLPIQYAEELKAIIKRLKKLYKNFNEREVR